MSVHLASDRFGKSGVRLATVERDGDRHVFSDLDIDVRLEGDFEAVHTRGDNSPVLTTDTMRGTCYALARHYGARSPATLGSRIAERLLEACPAASHARVDLARLPWERLAVDGAPHTHTFRPGPGGRQLTTIRQPRGQAPTVSAGADGVRVLKTTGSAFDSYIKDEYTTLPETRDRIMATTVAASWGYVDPLVADHAAPEHERLLDEVPATFCARFATHDESESVQHTLYEMGEAALAAHDELTWISFRMPNEHHILADLEPYGLDNPNHVFVVTDRPYGVIEGTIARDGPSAARAEPA
ncbi:urate oxidase [Egibacter rhizosphaerae]|uniref:Uricase n=1 Tax=Egibacter rhizosphaerae TaxID=1670831 RepID=A0A411YEX2_9ACTN|nr:urate oxidase [Egibacter rhizosphaerae]QBI19749.1 urate oxidase [Egibacter rhizosphaerae]